MRPLTNYDLLKYAKKLKIPNFRGVYMLDELPRRAKAKERAVINLASGDSEGTHWCAYKKGGTNVEYFDPIGNLKPPKELEGYLKDCELFYNYERHQNLDTVVCGHLCLKFLSEK